MKIILVIIVYIIIMSRLNYLYGNQGITITDKFTAMVILICCIPALVVSKVWNLFRTLLRVFFKS